MNYTDLENFMEVYGQDIMFPTGKTGMSENLSWSTSEDGLSDLIIETHTLNEDGTVTFVIYVPKLD